MSVRFRPTRCLLAAAASAATPPLADITSWYVRSGTLGLPGQVTVGHVHRSSLRPASAALGRAYGALAGRRFACAAWTAWRSRPLWAGHPIPQCLPRRRLTLFTRTFGSSATSVEAGRRSVSRMPHIRTGGLAGGPVRSESHRATPQKLCQNPLGTPRTANHDVPIEVDFKPPRHAAARRTNRCPWNSSRPTPRCTAADASTSPASSERPTPSPCPSRTGPHPTNPHGSSTNF